MGRLLTAGPLNIDLRCQIDAVRQVITANLALYDVAWERGGRREVMLDCESAESSPRAALGEYLVCAAMLVDAAPTGLRATTADGAEMLGTFLADGEHWTMRLPASFVERGAWLQVEDMLSLVLTTGWRRHGWVPLHAAGLTDGGRGLLVCAGGGGGKTTFTLAMVRRGWRALGDDKLLLGPIGTVPQAIAIKQIFNVDPAVAAWFPELGDLDALPEYSVWTPKRRLSLGSYWPAAPAPTMRPTHLLIIERVHKSATGGIHVVPVSTSAAISSLLHQSVIPTDRAAARPIIGLLAQMGEQVTAMRVIVPDGAYAAPDALAAIEDAIA